jgi:two-component system, NarL family, response regulator NreC
MIRIAIVDDHNIFAEGLSFMFAGVEDMQVVAKCHDGKSFLELMETTEIDVVLLDISLPDIDGMQISETLGQKHPSCKVVTLTMHDEPSVVRKMTKKGAKAYLLKNTSKDELLAAIRTVNEGKAYYSPDIMRLMLEDDGKTKKVQRNSLRPRLTNREQEVLHHIGEGLTTQQIADKLFVTIKAVEFHRSSLLTKFGVQNTAALIKQAIEYELLL